MEFLKCQDVRWKGPEKWNKANVVATMAKHPDSHSEIWTKLHSSCHSNFFGNTFTVAWFLWQCLEHLKLADYILVLPSHKVSKLLFITSVLYLLAVPTLADSEMSSQNGDRYSNSPVRIKSNNSSWSGLQRKFQFQFLSPIYKFSLLVYNLYTELVEKIYSLISFWPIQLFYL